MNIAKESWEFKLLLDAIALRFGLGVMECTTRPFEIDFYKASSCLEGSSMNVSPKVRYVIALGFGFSLIATVTMADWVPVNSPEAQGPAAFAVNPDNPAEMYAAFAVPPNVPVVNYAATDRLYKSKDGGASWTVVETGLGNIRAIGIDSENPSTIYIDGFKYTESSSSTAVPGERALLRSAVAGVSWTSAMAGLILTQFDEYIMYPSCSNFRFTLKSTIYFACVDYDQGLAFQASRSDGIWREISVPVDANNQEIGHWWVNSLAVMPSDPETIFADFNSVPVVPLSSVGRLGVYRTQDGGTTWQPYQLGLGIPILRYNGLLASPVQTGTVYALTVEGLFETSDAVARWKRILNRGAMSALAISAPRPDTLYAGTEKGGLFRSRDGGKHRIKVHRAIVKSGVWPS